MPAYLEDIASAKKSGIVERDAVEDAIESYSKVAEDGFSKAVEAMQELAKELSKALSKQGMQPVSISEDLAAMTYSLAQAMKSLKPPPRKQKRITFNVTARDRNGRIEQIEVVEHE